MVRGQRSSPTFLYGLFKVLAVISIVLILCNRLMSCILLKSQLEPNYVPIPSEVYDENDTYKNSEWWRNNPKSYPNSVAKQIAKEKYESSYSYYADMGIVIIRFAVTLLFLAINIFALVRGINLYKNTGIISTGSRIKFAFLFLIVFFTLFFACTVFSSTTASGTIVFYPV